MTQSLVAAATEYTENIRKESVEAITANLERNASNAGQAEKELLEGVLEDLERRDASVDQEEARLTLLLCISRSVCTAKR